MLLFNRLLLTFQTVLSLNCFSCFPCSTHQFKSSQNVFKNNLLNWTSKKNKNKKETFFSWYIFHLAYFAKPQLILTDRSCWLSCLVTIPKARSEPGKPWNMYFLCYPVLLLINEKILCIFLLPHDQTKPWLSMARAFDPFRPLSYSSAPFHQEFFLPGLFVKKPFKKHFNSIYLTAVYFL